MRSIFRTVFHLLMASAPTNCDRHKHVDEHIAFVAAASPSGSSGRTPDMQHLTRQFCHINMLTVAHIIRWKLSRPDDGSSASVQQQQQQQH